MLLNEIEVNTPDPGGAEACEYVEVLGTPGTLAPANLFFVSIDGDSGNFGSVSYVADISGVPFGTNGTITVVTDSDVCANRVFPAGTTLIFTSSFAMGFGAETYLLVQSPAPIFEGQDLDLNNDGVLDPALGLIPIDGVAWTLVADSSNAVYGGAPRLTVNTDVPDAATRFNGNTAPFSLGAWYWGNLAGPNAESVGYSAPFSPNFPAGGVLTPGAAPNAP